MPAGNAIAAWAKPLVFLRSVQFLFTIFLRDAADASEGTWRSTCVLDCVHCIRALCVLTWGCSGPSRRRASADARFGVELRIAPAVVTREW